MLYSLFHSNRAKLSKLTMNILSGNLPLDADPQDNYLSTSLRLLWNEVSKKIPVPVRPVDLILAIADKSKDSHPLGNPETLNLLDAYRKYYYSCSIDEQEILQRPEPIEIENRAKELGLYQAAIGNIIALYKSTASPQENLIHPKV